MQEHDWRNQPSQIVAEIHDLVERVQVAGVVETEKDEGRKAQDVEMLGLVGVAPAEVNEQSDQQVRRPYQVLEDDGPIQGRFPNHHGGCYLKSAAFDLVLR